MAAAHRATDRDKAKAEAKRARRSGHQRQTQAFRWLGVGAVGLGVGAALASGSAVANADTTHTGTGTSPTGGSHNAASASAPGSARAATTGTRSNDSAPAEARKAGKPHAPVGVAIGDTRGGLQPSPPQGNPGLAGPADAAVPTISSRVETPSAVRTASALTNASKAAATAAAASLTPVAPANPITVNPTLTFNDAIVLGNANATDAQGLPLTYTIVSAPSEGAKITFIRPTDTPVQRAGTFNYSPYATVLTGATEQFSMLVSETTPVDVALANLPVLGSLAASILIHLHQAPILSTVLAPIIGYAVTRAVQQCRCSPTHRGRPGRVHQQGDLLRRHAVSTNFFPASGLTTGQSAPTILAAPGLAIPGNTNPLAKFFGTSDRIVPGVAPLRDAGYNVVTWDPRGEFASGGLLQLNNPFYEGRDVSAIITWTLTQPETETNQRIGMVGASYGGVSNS